MALLRVCVELCAAPGFKSVRTFNRICTQVAERRIEQKIRSRKTMREDEAGRDDKDEALRNPENNEDFKEQAAHFGSVLLFAEVAIENELVTHATNCLDSIFVFSIVGQFSPKPADMHVKAAIEWIERPAKDSL